MMRLLSGLILLIFVLNSYAWDNNYIDISNQDSKPRNDVSKVTFRLYSTRSYHQPDEDVYEDVKFDEKTQTASLMEDTLFDNSLETVVIAHGNGGAYKMDMDFWVHYAQVAEERGHRNIIGIRWGSGSSPYKHAFVGIKAARVIQSLKEDHGLNVSQVQGIGFSWGANIISAMATEIQLSDLGKIKRLSLMDPAPAGTFDVYGTEQIGFYNKTFASFVDVYHTSTVGIHDQSVGDVDIWVNGGQTQPRGIQRNAHHAAPFMYAKTILLTDGDCKFKAWPCTDPNWTSFPLQSKGQGDTCQYGNDNSNEKPEVIGEYIDKSLRGNYLLFMTKNFRYCEDIDCSKVC